MASTPQTPRVRSRIGAFFDMDKTLIAENSGSAYMRDRWENGAVTGWDLAKGAGAYLQYKLGALDIQAWSVEMMRGFKGQEEAALVTEGLELFAERIRPSNECRPRGWRRHGRS